jgi:hypothetical protein
MVGDHDDTHLEGSKHGGWSQFLVRCKPIQTAKVAKILATPFGSLPFLTVSKNPLFIILATWQGEASVMPHTRPFTAGLHAEPSSRNEIGRMLSPLPFPFNG